jgi:hypothetical protein
MPKIRLDSLFLSPNIIQLLNKNLRDAVDKLDFSDYNASEDRTNTAHRVLAND